jgi:hypothetical protein
MNTTTTKPREVPNVIDTPELDKIPLPQWLEVTLYNPLQKKELDKLINNHTWVTAQRIKIPVKNMETSHIINCIRCWEGKGKSNIPSDYLGGKKKWLEIFNQELNKRR